MSSLLAPKIIALVISFLNSRPRELSITKLVVFSTNIFIASVSGCSVRSIDLIFNMFITLEPKALETGVGIRSTKKSQPESSHNLLIASANVTTAPEILKLSPATGRSVKSKRY